jgi:hypothetical protein
LDASWHCSAAANAATRFFFACTVVSPAVEITSPIGISRNSIGSACHPGSVVFDSAVCSLAVGRAASNTHSNAVPTITRVIRNWC